jgi:menaquinone-dependent protoporphyrinogen oxidase
MRIAVIYATTDGQTGKVAEHVAARLAAAGHDAAPVLAGEAAPEDLAGADAAVLAGSVHAGHYQRELLRFAERNRDRLAGLPTLFLSVSLSAAGHDPKGVEELPAIVARMEKETGWTPGRVVHVAGALRFSEYDFFKAWIMRRIAADRGDHAGRHEDREYTDWTALDADIDDWTATLG